MEQSWCSVQDAALHATDVGVPTGKQRVFVVAVKRRPGVAPDVLAAKLAKWRLQQRVAVKPVVSTFLGHEGLFFLKRLPGEKGVFSFSKLTITITHGHIMGRRPPLDEYRPHPTDEGRLGDHRDLTWEGFVKLTTAQDDFNVPPSVRRIDAALALEEFTLPPMLREAVNVLGIHGVVDRNAKRRRSRE